jgi:hypothetical protein
VACSRAIEAGLARRCVQVRQYRIAAAIAALSVCSAAMADDASKAVTATLNVDFFSKYIWRGGVSDNGGVMQPTFTVNYQGFSAYAFGSMPFTNWNQYGTGFHPRMQFNEYDLGVSYARTIAKYGWTLGFYNYVYPQVGYRQTSEAYIGVALPFNYSPTIGVYHDVESNHGWYANASVGQTLPNVFRKNDGKYLPLVLAESVGFGDSCFDEYYYSYDRPAFADLLLSASCPVPCGKNITWTPSVKYSTLLTDSLNEGQPRRSNLWLGLTFNYAF